MQHVRVLVVLPFYGGSLPIGQYVADALKGLGHTVEVFQAPAFHGAFTALTDLRVTSDRLEHLENSFLQTVSQAVQAKAESFQADLVLAMAQAPLTRQTLKRLRKDGVATAMWFVEDFRLFTYWRAFAPFYDVFAVIQKEPFLRELAAIGQPNALYVPLAADPAFHKPLELSDQERREYGADVAFLGAGYPNRRAAFRRLTHHGLKIWGTEWDGDSALAPFVQRGGARISPTDAVKVYNATRVNLNLHSSVRAGDLVSGGDFVNPRTFELAAIGAFQLVDRRGLMAELFAEDELATFGDWEECLELLDRYLGDEAARHDKAARARERVVAEHTYQRRMETLLAFVAERLEGWPRQRRDPGFAGLGEAGPELAELVRGLDLPPDVGFKDMVWAVKQRQGALSDLEAAVLFLDAWKQQYTKDGS